MFTFIRNCPTFPKWLYCLAFSTATYKSSDCLICLPGLLFWFVYINSYIMVFKDFSKCVLYVRLFWVEIFLWRLPEFFLRALDMWSTLDQTVHSFIHSFLPLELTLHLEVYLKFLIFKKTEPNNFINELDFCLKNS